MDVIFFILEYALKDLNSFKVQKKVDIFKWIKFDSEGVTLVFVFQSIYFKDEQSQ